MKPFGLQLYTLRKPFAEDPIGTLERIKATGYDEVEFAASLDLDFQPFADRMQAIGLNCPSVHVGLADMTSRPERVLEVAKTLGCRFIVMPFVDPNTADWPKVVSELETFARKAAGEGFTTCYHHHHFEFDTSKGTRPFDILLTADPALVFFELDVYWLKTGGEEPVAMIDRLAGRVKLLHLKDALPDGPMTDLGLGNLDFPAIIAAGRAAGVAHMFVENDIPPKPYWPSVETSAAFLQTLD